VGCSARAHSSGGAYIEYRLPSALEQIRCILSIPTKETEVRLVRHLTAQEMQSILDAPDPARRVGIRDRAMLHLCFAGGLRVSELVGVRVIDVRLQPEPNEIVDGNLLIRKFLSASSA
jgi:site-specific recombinase XerD